MCDSRVSVVMADSPGHAGHRRGAPLPVVGAAPPFSTSGSKNYFSGQETASSSDAEPRSLEDPLLRAPVAAHLRPVGLARASRGLTRAEEAGAERRAVGVLFARHGAFGSAAHDREARGGCAAVAAPPRTVSPAVLPWALDGHRRAAAVGHHIGECRSEGEEEDGGTHRGRWYTAGSLFAYTARPGKKKEGAPYDL
jgi:hypothetical protein